MISSKKVILLSMTAAIIGTCIIFKNDIGNICVGKKITETNLMQTLLDSTQTLIQSSTRPWDKLNVRYLSEEDMSGSGQFSGEQLQKILNEIKERYGIKPHEVLIVDLRGEAHAFVKTSHGPEPITIQNKTGKGYTYIQENEIARALTGQPFTIEPHKFAADPHPIKIQNAVLSSEEALIVDTHKAHYLRIPVPDYSVPTHEHMEIFENALKTAKEKGIKWVHIHCHGGLGRTTSFMALLDMIRKPGLSFDQIVERQKQTGGRDLMGPPEKGQSVDDSAKIVTVLKAEYERLHAESPIK